MDITPQDADLLKTISEKFSNNIKKHYKGDAVKAFSENLGFFEKLGIITAKLSSIFNDSNTASDKKARSHAAYCVAVLPALKRAFGEEFLINALPAEVRTQHVVDLCMEAKAPALADLCQKAINKGPSAAL